ncbi:MAG: hypothetical protein V1853_03440 [bacterium]
MSDEKYTTFTNMYQIPPPEERFRILVTDRIKNKQSVDDKDFRFTAHEVNHQVRLELVGIGGYLQMLIDGEFDKLTAKQKELISSLIEQTKRQEQKISGVIELEKLKYASIFTTKTYIGS